MRLVIVLLFILLSFVRCDAQTTELAKKFRDNLAGTGAKIQFIDVPRGFIMSLEEGYFFNDGSVKIKKNSLKFLDSFAKTLLTIKNDCVVEDHTGGNTLKGTIYNNDWELSMARSANLVQYLITYGKVPIERITSLGCWECMPVQELHYNRNGAGVDSQEQGEAQSLQEQNKISSPKDRHVDFVILDYDVSR